MSARFKLLHYVPDPFSDGRVPIAALVDHGRGIQFARAHHIPGPGCLGGARSADALQMMLEYLKSDQSAQTVLRSLGPQASLADDWLPVPADVSDAVAWIEANVLPQRPAGGQAKESSPRAPRRDVHGYRFFETWKVAPYVRKKYSPAQLPNASGRAAKEISHYVPGSDELLLMEPLIATRSNFDKDLTEISESFLAWQTLFDLHPTRTRLPKFVAYVFGSKKYIEEAARVLDDATDEVVGVDDSLQRHHFLDEIKRIGISGQSQGTLGGLH